MSDARKREDVAKANWARRVQVLMLRNQGLEFKDIGERMGVSKQAAFIMYNKVKNMTVEDMEKLV